MERPYDFWRLPLLVVVDLAEEIQQFQLEADEAHTYEHELREILDEVLMYLADEWKADQSVGAMGAHFAECYPEEGEVLAAACEKLARALLAKLRLFHLYASDHYLHYDFAAIWINPTTPVLRRHHVR